MDNPSWMRLLYELQDESEASTANIVVRLPEWLNRGASVLEIARLIHDKPESVARVMDRLAQYDLIKAQPSGLDVPFGKDLYSLTSNGVKFFKFLGESRTRRPAS